MPKLLDSYLSNVQQNNFNNVYCAKAPPQIKIRNPKLEISNKPKGSNLNIEIQNEIIWNFMFFDHLDLFRISSFEFVILFILGVLCVFARVIFLLIL